MSESTKHIELVGRIKSYLYDFVPEEYHSLIDVDSAESPKTPAVGSFIPDAYYKYHGVLIVGEAKTEDDLIRKHSREQFEAYLNECERFEGASYLIVGVPWTCAAAAKNYFKRNRGLWLRTTVIVLDDAGRGWEL